MQEVWATCSSPLITHLPWFIHERHLPGCPAATAAAAVYVAVPPADHITRERKRGRMSAAPNIRKLICCYYIESDGG